LLMVVSHNLRTYMRAVALRELGFFVFLRIYWTTSSNPVELARLVVNKTIVQERKGRGRKGDGW